MSSSKTTVSNMALSFLGIGEDIADVDSETSAPALACRRFWDEAKSAMLEGFLWGWVKKIAALDLVEENPGDTNEWLYSYRYPSDCLYMRRILSGVRTDSAESRAKFTEARDDEGRLIFTDVEDAVAEYTMNDDEVDRWPASFRTALAMRLAFLIGPRLTKGDPKAMTLILNMYNLSCSEAEKNAGNEEAPDLEPDASSILFRQ